MASSVSSNGTTASPSDYWESRARQFARTGDGLAAVCSYGMPEFYNRAIHVTQRLAIEPWFRGLHGRSVLDVGCGVGRWSRMMAARGAHVTGIDLSPTMIAEAKRRTEASGLGDRCRFEVGDLVHLNTGREYDFILGVTVLQHLMLADCLGEALQRLSGHLSKDGRMVLVEVAPHRSNPRCDTAVFKALTFETYVAAAARHGLQLEAATGVDPMPLKVAFLPYYRRLPKPVAVAGLAASTALSLPIDAIFGRRLLRQSWHKVLVFRRSEGAYAA